MLIIKRRLILLSSVALFLFAFTFENKLYFDVYNREGKKRKIALSTQNLIIFQNSKSCIGCFNQLRENIPANKKIVIITLSDSSSLNRNTFYRKNRKLFPSCESYFTYCQNPKTAKCPNQLFDSLQVDLTPAIIYFNHSSNAVLLSYKELFDTKGVLKIDALQNW